MRLACWHPCSEPYDARGRPVAGWPRQLAAVGSRSRSGLTGCAGLGQPAPYDSPGINGLEIPTPSGARTTSSTSIDNPWLALGARRHLALRRDRRRRRRVGTIDAEVLDGTSEVAGLTATAVPRRSRTSTATPTWTTRFYAQDADGNVWLVGASTRPPGSLASRRGRRRGRAGHARRPAPGRRLADLPRSRTGPRPAPTVEDQSREMVQTRDEAGAGRRPLASVYETGVGLVGVEDLDAGWQAGCSRA